MTATFNSGLPHDVWYVRGADTAGNGRAVSRASLVSSLEDGAFNAAVEVRGPGEPGFTPMGEHPFTGEYIPSRPLISRRPYDEGDADLTPLIDVIFQLIIFFMISATYSVQKTLDTPATSNPDAAAARTIEELQQTNIMVKVAADGSITVDGSNVEPEELQAVLTAALKETTGGDRAAELVLDASEEATQNSIVQVVDAAGAAGIQKIMLVERIPAGASP